MRGARGLLLVLLVLGVAGALVLWIGTSGGGGVGPGTGQGAGSRRPDGPGLSGRGEPTLTEEPPEAEGEDLAEWTGAVADPDGAPVPGATLLLGGITGKRGPVARARTDDAGRFRLTARRGALRAPLHAGAAGFLPARLEVSRKGERDLVFRLERDLRRVRVVLQVVDGAGAAVAGVKGWTRQEEADVDLPAGWKVDLAPLFAFDQAATGATWSTVDFTTNDEGLAVLPGRLPGRMVVRGVSGDRLLDAQVPVPPPPAGPPIRIVLQAGRVVTGTARVAKDAAWGCAHAGHVFEIQLGESVEGAWKSLGISDAGGAFRAAVPPATRYLWVATEGHPPVEVRLPPGDAPVDLGEVAVPDARPVHGRVRYAGGRPAAYVVLVYGDGERDRVTTASDGSFRIPALPRPSRRDRVEVLVPGRDAPVLPPPPDLSAPPVEIVLPSEVVAPPIDEGE